MGLKDELARLREQVEGKEEWKTPIEVRVVTKAFARADAIRQGQTPPPCTPQERAEVHQQDVDLLNGGADRQRLVPGWEDEFAQQMVDRWEALAKERLARIAHGEDLRTVYEDRAYDEPAEEPLPLGDMYTHDIQEEGARHD